MNNAKVDRVVMQIQNIINYSLVVMTNFNGMTLLHMTINGHTLMTRYSEKRQGGPKRGPKTSWGTLHWEQKLSDMTVVILSRTTCPT